MAKSRSVDFETLLPLILQALEQNHTFTFTAFGNSMHPTIIGGKDRVTLGPVNGDLKKGDVVFYRRENGVFVLHRIIETNRDRFYLCGDNQFIVEKNITREQVIAKLFSLERNGKPKSFSPLGTKGTLFFLTFRRLFLHIANKIHRTCIKRS